MAVEGWPAYGADKPTLSWKPGSRSFQTWVPKRSLGTSLNPELALVPKLRLGMRYEKLCFPSRKL